MYRSTIKEFDKMSFTLKRTIINQVNRLKNQGYKRGRCLSECAKNSLLTHVHCEECVHGFPIQNGLASVCVEGGLKGLLR